MKMAGRMNRTKATASLYILQRRLGQTLAKHRRLVAGFFFLVVHYPIGLLVAFSLAPDLAIGWVNAGILLLGSWIFPLINILSLRASKDVDAGHFTVMSNVTPVVTIVAATVLLNEQLNNHQLVGAAIIIASAFIVTLPYLRSRTRSKTSGVVIALTVFLLAGLATVFERWMLTRIDLGAYLVFGWGAQTIWMALTAWPERKHFKILKNKKYFMPIMGYAVASSIKGVFFLAALQLSGNASLFSAFASFTAIMVVPAAYYLLKEKQWLWLKILAAITGTVGLIVLNTG